MQARAAQSSWGWAQGAEQRASQTKRFPLFPTGMSLCSFPTCALVGPGDLSCSHRQQQGQEYLGLGGRGLGGHQWFVCSLWGWQVSRCLLALSAAVPPKLKKLKSPNVHVGEKISLKCEATAGNPQPSYKWFKDGKELKKSKDIRIKYGNGK